MRWLGVLIGALIGAGLVLAGRDMLGPAPDATACKPCATEPAAAPPDPPPAETLPRNSSEETLVSARSEGYTLMAARGAQDEFGLSPLAEEGAAEGGSQARAQAPSAPDSHPAVPRVSEAAAGIPEAEGPVSPESLGSGPAPEQHLGRAQDASSEVGSAAVGGGRTAAVAALDGESSQVVSDAGMAVPGPLQPESDASPNNPALSWHSFWQPFTSELSARGFASRLESLTGLDYQVRRTGPGRYEVVFAHLDEVQRDAHLARIQAVTGLDLGGGR